MTEQRELLSSLHIYRLFVTKGSKKNVFKTVRLTKARCTGHLQSVDSLLETDKTDNICSRILAVFLRISAIYTENSLENFYRIQLIRGQFSREFKELSRQSVMLEIKVGGPSVSCQS